MKILVTGGSGFIGSNFIRYMLSKYKSYKIINYDKLTYAGNPENLKDIIRNPRYKFVKADICDKRTALKAVSGCDAVINFAAESHVDRSIKDPSIFLKTNYFGVYNMIEAARKCKIKKFLQISTDEVYGSAKKASFKETDPLNPSSPYSSSKAGADILALSYYTTYGFPVIITRSSNNFGPCQYPEKLIPLFITNAMDDKLLPVYGTGKNVRDWIYVEDNCRGLDIVFHKGKNGEIYNIGGGNEKENIYITNLILKLTGKTNKLITYVKDRLGHDFRYSIDGTKSRKLGFKPVFSFENAMERTIAWYVENRKWWEPLK
jgi:dTDP-glucose 4,6-dehydratase